MDIGRDAAQERAEREYSDRRREHATSAEAIGHPTADRNEDRQAQRIAREDRLHAQGSDVERVGDRWHRGVENRRVERFHEKADCDQPGQQPLGGRRRRSLAWRSLVWRGVAWRVLGHQTLGCRKARFAAPLYAPAKEASTMICASLKISRKCASLRKLRSEEHT